MIHPGGPVPRGVEIVFHVRVIGEEFTIGIEVGIEDIAVARRVDFPLGSVWGDFINDSPGSQTVAIVSATIRHTGKEVVFAPIVGNAVDVRGDRFRIVAAYEENGFAVGSEFDGVDSVIAPG